MSEALDAFFAEHARKEKAGEVSSLSRLEVMVIGLYDQWLIDNRIDLVLGEGWRPPSGGLTITLDPSLPPNPNPAPGSMSVGCVDGKAELKPTSELRWLDHHSASRVLQQKWVAAGHVEWYDIPTIHEGDPGYATVTVADGKRK